MSEPLDEMGELLSLVEQSWKVRALEAENALERANEQIEKLRLEILEIFGQVKKLRQEIENTKRAVGGAGSPWRDDPHQDGYYGYEERRRWINEQMKYEKYLSKEQQQKHLAAHDWMKHILDEKEEF